MEHHRVEEKRAYRLFPGNLLDPFTILASRVCNTPVSFADVIDDQQQLIKSCFGAAIEDMSRRESLSQFVTLSDGVFEINDLKKDSRFQEVPCVTGEPHLRFYAGIPLVGDKGGVLGTLSVAGFEPSRLTDAHKQHLRDLSDIVLERFDLWKRNRNLEQTNLFNKRLIKVVSHDIRSPLTGIIGAADFLMEEDLDEKDKTELVQIINESAGQIQTIVTKLLDSELLSFGEAKSTPEPYDAVKGLKAVIQRFAFSARHKNITIKQDFAGDIPVLVVDGLYCERILANLLSSAIKFTKQDGKVDIRCRYREYDDGSTKLMLQVEDTGIGMTQKQLRHLADTTGETDAADIDNESSYGLRMYIVKKLCEACRADVTGTSELDKGTVITVGIPAPRAES